MDKKKASKVTEYEVIVEGVTINQAQAIQSIIVAINNFKARDRAPMEALQGEVARLDIDFRLLKDISVEMKYNLNIELVKRIEERLVRFDNEVKSKENRVDSHKSNMKYIDDLIKKINFHIKEKINKEIERVTYTYDWVYFEPFLDLASITFEMKIEEQQPIQEASEETANLVA